VSLVFYLHFIVDYICIFSLFTFLDLNALLKIVHCDVGCYQKVEYLSFCVRLIIFRLLGQILNGLSNMFIKNSL